MYVNIIAIKAFLAYKMFALYTDVCPTRTKFNKKFSAYQNAILNKSFSTNQYPSRKQMELLGTNLSLMRRQIKSWFERARAKLTRDATCTNSTIGGDSIKNT